VAFGLLPAYLSGELAHVHVETVLRGVAGTADAQHESDTARDPRPQLRYVEIRDVPLELPIMGFPPMRLAGQLRLRAEDGRLGARDAQAIGAQSPVQGGDRDERQRRDEQWALRADVEFVLAAERVAAVLARDGAWRARERPAELAPVATQVEAGPA